MELAYLGENGCKAAGGTVGFANSSFFVFHAARFTKSSPHCRFVARQHLKPDDFRYRLGESMNVGYGLKDYGEWRLYHSNHCDSVHAISS